MTAYVFKRNAYWKYGTEPNSSLITTGSISFENGIARGFSNTNYLSFNIGTTQKTDLVEIVIAFNTGTWSVVSDKACGILGGDGFPEIQLYKGRSNIGGGDYIGSYVYSTNQDVEWKIQIQNGALAIFRLNPETNTYEAEGSVKVSSPATGIINIGRNSSTRYLKDGFVDITKLKVYVNGVLIKRFTETVPATKDDYDFTADKCYVLKRKRPTEYRKTVIDTATAGTYTFDVAKDRTAKIILVGAGGSGGQVWSSHAAGSGGGSGACVYIKAKLTAGTYTITNGAGASPYSKAGGNSTLVKDGVTLITASGGAGGGGGGNPPGVGGTYSISDNLEVEKEIIVSNGNSGTQGTLYVVGSGGLSVYGGYGAGGVGNGGSGVAGYIWVELTTDETDYDYKIDNDACYVLKRKQYWKWEGSESTELAYACYKNNLGEAFVYLKTPIGVDGVVYTTDTTGLGFGQIATSSTELNSLLYVTGISATESNVNITTNFAGMGVSTHSCTRYTDGDIYITVGTQTVVPGTKDDYDFTTD